MRVLINYTNIRGVVGRVATPQQRAQLAELRDAWQHAIDGKYDFVIHNNHFGGRDLLETWFNGIAFHPDLDRQADVSLLQSLDPATSQALQVNVFRMARCILALDCIVAEALGEETLPASRLPESGWMFTS